MKKEMNLMNNSEDKKEYTVFICDDEQEQITQITYFVGGAGMILADNKISFDIKSATSYDQAVDYLNENNLDGGIYFLDIELKNDTKSDTGFDLAEFIKEKDKRAQIIFITSHDDLSLVTFERRLGPVDYIVKSPDINKLRRRVVKTIEVAIANLEKSNYMKELTFSYKVGRQIINVNLDDVIYITTTSVPHKLLLVETAGRAQFIGSIQDYLEKNPLLEKISQSCIANPKNIKLIDLPHHKVIFKNGHEESFSRTNVKHMAQLIKKYNFESESIARKFN